MAIARYIFPVGLPLPPNQTVTHEMIEPMLTEYEGPILYIPTKHGKTQITPLGWRKQTEHYLWIDEEEESGYYFIATRGATEVSISSSSSHTEEAGIRAIRIPEERKVIGITHPLSLTLGWEAGEVLHTLLLYR